MTLRRTIAALLLPVLLQGCFLMPGKFASNLDLRRDGTFSFAYKGEVVFMSPEDMIPGGDGGFGSAEWSDSNAYCSTEAKADAKGPDKGKADKDGKAPPPPVIVVPVEVPTATSAKPPAKGDAKTDAANKDGSTAKDEATVEVTDVLGEQRECTKAEIAQQKKEWEQNRKEAAERKAEEARQFGSIFGYTPGDDVANRKLATMLMKYEGYRSVTYKGKGVFDVDYQRTGRIDHDFIFPLLPKSDIVFPFVIVRRQADGVVRVTAPALIGGGMKAFAARLQGLGKMAGGGKLSPPDDSMPSPTRGSFTITSDGEFVTNNTEDGPAKVANGRQVMWDIGPDSDKIPEAVIRIGASPKG